MDELVTTSYHVGEIRCTRMTKSGLQEGGGCYDVDTGCDGELQVESFSMTVRQNEEHRRVT